MNYEEKLKEYFVKFEEFNRKTGGVIAPFKKDWQDGKRDKRHYQKYAILSNLEWCNQISKNAVTLYINHGMDCYYTIATQTRFVFEIGLNIQVIFLIPKLIELNLNPYSESNAKNEYKLYKDYLKHKNKSHNEIIKELLFQLLTFNIIADYRQRIYSEKRNDDAFHADREHNALSELKNNGRVKTEIRNMHKLNLEEEIHKVITKYHRYRSWDNCPFSAKCDFVNRGIAILKGGSKKKFSILNYVFENYSNAAHGTVLLHANMFQKLTDDYKGFYCEEISNQILIITSTQKTVVEHYNRFFNENLGGEINKLNKLLNEIIDLKNG